MSKMKEVDSTLNAIDKALEECGVPELPASGIDTTRLVFSSLAEIVPTRHMVSEHQ